MATKSKYYALQKQSVWFPRTNEALCKSMANCHREQILCFARAELMVPKSKYGALQEQG